MSYNNLKKAITDEQELIKLMQQLPEAELRQLMNASANYGAAMKAKAEAEKEKEITKRAEMEAEVKKKHEEEQTKRHQETLKQQKEQLKLKAEELKKVEEAKVAEGKKLADYRAKKEKELLEHRLQREKEAQADLTKAKLDAKREWDRLDTEKAEREKQKVELEHRLKEEKKEKEMERQKELIRFKLKEKARLMVEMADFDLEQRKKAHQAFYKDETERMVAIEEVRARADLQKEHARLQMRMQFFSGPEATHTYERAGIGLIGAAYGFKVVAPLIARGLRNYFFRPTLVTKSHRSGLFSDLVARVRRGASGPRPDVILPPVLEQRMQRVIDGTTNTWKRSGFFGHMLLYGKAGTGKTMFAEKLARMANMDYAEMSGPSFDQFTSAEAIAEIKNLFKWAKSSRRGLILFIDECDSFLEDRSTLTPERVRVLNEFIYQTGTESNKSRVTTTIEFPSPSEDELRRLTKQYVEQYIENEHLRAGKAFPWSLFSKQQKLDASVLTEEKINELAATFASHNFVGRDVTNTVIALAQNAYASEDFKITEELLEQVIAEQVLKKEREEHFALMRQKRQQKMQTQHGDSLLSK